MDQKYLNKLVELFNDNRTDGYHEIKRNKAKYIFEIQDGHLVIADIYGTDPYDNKIHIQYDFYDDTFVERIFEIEGRGKKTTERLKSEVMETYSGSDRTRLLRKKYLLGDLSEVMVVEDGRSMFAFGNDGVIDTIELRYNGKLIQWYKFSDDGKIRLDMSHMVPSDFKPTKLAALYQDYDQVNYEDPDYELILEKYPDGKISSLKLMKGKETYNKIIFAKTGKSQIEFHFDEPVIEQALSRFDYGKIIEDMNNGKDVITIG